MKLKNKSGMKERGGVLVIALILVSIAAVVTASSMRGSLMQEKMVSNQNSKSTSFMAAESGAASFNQWINDPNTVWGSSTWQNSIPTSAEGRVNMGSQGYYWINPSDVVWGASSVSLKVRGYAKPDSTSAQNAQTILQLTMTKPSSSSATYIGGPGMTAGGNISVSGNATLSGNARTNGNITVTGGKSSLTNGTIMAAGTASMKGVDASLISSGVPIISIPVVTAAWLAQMSAAASVQSCKLTLSGDQAGKIYYCNGNLSLSGSFSNATIVSSGTISHNGSGQMGGGSHSSSATTVAVVAAGNITINGSSNDNAVYWTNGSFTQNGSSSLTGTIVAGGDIQRNGVYNFSTSANIDNDQISTTATSSVSRLTAWQEVLQ